MGFPRARPGGVRDQTNRRLLTAGQEGRYAPQRNAWLATMDPGAVITGNGWAYAGTGWSGWYLLRLKGLLEDESINAALMNSSGAGDVEHHIAVCEYQVDTAVRVSEVCRGKSADSVIQLPVTRLDKNKRYAVAYGVSGAGLRTFDYGWEGAVPLWWTSGAAEQPVRFSSGSLGDVSFASSPPEKGVLVRLLHNDPGNPFMVAVRSFWY